MPLDPDLDQRLRELEALNLLTNRMLNDLISLQVSSGAYNRDTVLRLIRFSADQVIAGSPHTRELVDFYADVTAQRMAPAPDKP